MTDDQLLLTSPHVQAAANATSTTRQSSGESEAWSRGPHWSKFNGPIPTDESGHPLANSSVELPSGSVRPIRVVSDSGICMQVF